MNHTLSEHGFLDGIETYLVGGAVRDSLLNVHFHERDYVVVGATPEQLLEKGFTPVGKDFPVFLHPQTHEEYALARTERKTGHGYTGFACYAQPDVTLEQDLERRDLTINAIAQSRTGELIDPWGGIRDLELKLLRHVSPAFAEDPLRVLRAARFAARFHYLGFTIAEETYTLMRQLVSAGEMKTIVAERVWLETEKALSTATPVEYFLVLHRCGALEQILSCELPKVIRFPALEQVTAITTDLVFRYAAWVADLAIILGNDKAAIQSTTENLRIPNTYADMARLLLLSIDIFSNPRLNTEAVLNFYQSTDAWRRPERFEQLESLCRAICHTEKVQTPLFTGARIDKLFTPAKELRTISVQPFISQGLKGAAIGEALQQARSNALTQYWQQDFI